MGDVKFYAEFQAFRESMARLRWSVEFAAAMGRIGWMYYADCMRGRNEQQRLSRRYLVAGASE